MVVHFRWCDYKGSEVVTPKRNNAWSLIWPTYCTYLGGGFNAWRSMAMKDHLQRFLELFAGTGHGMGWHDMEDMDLF